MHKPAAIASYPGHPYAPIMVFDGMFSSVPNRSWLSSVHKKVISRPPGPRALASLRPALSGLRLPRPHLSCDCRRVSVCCSESINGLGSSYPRGSGCLTRPPRDDSSRGEPLKIVLRIDPSRGALDWAKNARGGKMSPKADSVSSLRLRSSSPFSMGHSGALRSVRTQARWVSKNSVSFFWRLPLSSSDLRVHVAS